MNIKITEKYKPFSHEAGTMLLIPKSSWRVRVYPAKIELENLDAPEIAHTIFPQIEGPIEGFTVMQDLEKGFVRIFAKSFSYRLFNLDGAITLLLERCREEGIAFKWKDETDKLLRKEKLTIPMNGPLFSSKLCEKMHFGSSKKQDWTLVKRRLRLDEILPIWFELGKNLPQYPLANVGTARFLSKIEALISEKNRTDIGPSFLELFKRGFEGILSPRLTDTDYQSVSNEEEVPKELSPLILLQQGALLIRKLLIEKQGETLTILPCLPKELHAGRFVNIDCGEGLILDLEWSKKLIRRLILKPKGDLTLNLCFQKPIHSFRLRLGWKGRGKEVLAGTPLELKKGRLYILDRFQK